MRLYGSLVHMHSIYDTTLTSSNIVFLNSSSSLSD